MMNFLKLLDSIQAIEKIKSYDEKLIVQGENKDLIKKQLDSLYPSLKVYVRDIKEPLLPTMNNNFICFYDIIKDKILIYHREFEEKEALVLFLTKIKHPYEVVSVASEAKWDILKLFKSKESFREEVLESRLTLERLEKDKKLDALEYATLEFCGATRKVGCSSYIVESDKSKIMLDCGIGFFKEKIPIIAEQKSIEKIVLTHSHADHAFYIPLMIRKGFKGTIYCTEGTLLTYYLSCKEHLNTFKNQSEFTKEDFETSLFYFKVLETQRKYSLELGISVTLLPSNHCIGSVMCELELKTTKRNFLFLYTGDYKNTKSDLYTSISNTKKYDVILSEGTYGATDQRTEKSKEIPLLVELFQNVIKRGGNVLIPIFSNRVYEFFFYVYDQIKKYDLYVSNALKNTLNIALDAKDAFLKDSYTKIKELRDKLKNIPIIGKKSLSTRSIIVVPSGMLEGGPSVMLLKDTIQEPNNLILFTGFLSNNSLGKKVLDAKKGVTLVNKEEEVIQKMVVQCERRVTRFLSGHSNYSETENFLSKVSKKQTKIYLVHGEENGLKELAKKLLSSPVFEHKPRIFVPYLRQKVRLL